MSVEEKGDFLGSGDEAFSNEIFGSLVEAAALLGLDLEDNSINIICDENNIYGSLERENNAAIPASMNANPNAKKEEHNAKERERRMKLSHTYFSLCSLLPNARRSKKRWSSATIIDKAVDYIPTLEKEIENLKQKKQKLIEAKEMSNGRVVEGLEIDDNSSVSIHQLCKGEVIIQICINQRNTMKLSTLIHKAEAQGHHIIGVSAVSVSHHHPTLTCNLHLQMDRSLQEAADRAILRKRVISWLF